MSYIIRTGNLAQTPQIQQGKSNLYTRAAVVVNDREQNEAGEWVDTGNVLYNVTVFGNQAENLVAAAQESGNIRVVFGGSYRVKEYTNKAGEKIVAHDVLADFVGASFQGQKVAVTKPATTGEPG